MGNFLPSGMPGDLTSPSLSPSDNKEVEKLLKVNQACLDDMKRKIQFNDAKIKHCEKEALRCIREDNDVEASKWLERNYYCGLKKKRLREKRFEFETQKKQIMGIENGIRDSIDLVNRMLQLEKEIMKDESGLEKLGKNAEGGPGVKKKRGKAEEDEGDPIDRINFIEEGLKRLKRVVEDEKFK